MSDVEWIISQAAIESKSSRDRFYHTYQEFVATKLGKELQELTKKNPYAYLIAMIYTYREDRKTFPFYLVDYVKWVARQKFDFNLEKLKEIYDVCNLEKKGLDWDFGYEEFVRFLEKALDEDKTPEYLSFAKLLSDQYRASTGRFTNSVDYIDIQGRYKKLIEPDFLPWTAEPWQAAISDQKVGLANLFALAYEAKGVKPTAKWIAKAKPIIDVSDIGLFCDVMEKTVTLLKAIRTEIGGSQGDFIRGLAWFLGLIQSPKTIQILYELSIASSQKLPDIGARCPKGFDGAITALEMTGSIEALAAISNTKQKVGENQLKKKVANALESGAEKMGVGVDELEELVVPTYELSPEGTSTKVFDDISMVLTVDSRKVILSFSREGKVLKAIPKATVSEFSREIKELKSLQKQLETTLRNQRERIESLYLQNRRIPFRSWQDRYFNHPLLKAIVRNLIWTFTIGETKDSYIFHDDGWKDLRGNPVNVTLDAAEVELWHPLFSSSDEVSLWRDLIFSFEISQPFKQAFREIYVLTDAEARTGTYSNRFAAHILKQHQMAALGRTRGWRIQLLGFFDAGYREPTRVIPQHNLRARFYIEIIEIEADAMTDSGIALYVSSDLVEFLDERMERVNLSEVPPIVFSEILRDVDLFVGVASIANDPNWMDHTNRPQGYWQTYSFGDLTESAKSRREILSRLLPRLSIAKVATLEEKFLLVKGKLRTYKIHLGSGNILMPPNDQYLCIVPSAKSSEDRPGFLPSDGDNILSIIISKAILLADDDRIKDQTILSQIHRI